MLNPRYGHFSGINRKVQLKYQPQGAPRKSSEDDDGLYQTSVLISKTRSPVQLIITMATFC